MHHQEADLVIQPNLGSQKASSLLGWQCLRKVAGASSTSAGLLPLPLYGLRRDHPAPLTNDWPEEFHIRIEQVGCLEGLTFYIPTQPPPQRTLWVQNHCSFDPNFIQGLEL